MNPKSRPHRISLTRVSGHTFAETFLESNSLILDLGANQGVFSLGIQSRWGCSDILVVEPTPCLAAQLENIEGLSVRQCVVNAFGERAFFRIDPGNSESSSIVVNEYDENCLVVPGVTLSELIGDHQVVDLVKIDVEGAEIEIFRSTPDDVLKRVKQFTVEFHDFKKGSGVSKADVLKTFERMRALGFRVFVNSFWTYGDVLFVNTAFIPIGKKDAVSLALSGRWWPGMKRVAARLRGRTGKTL